MATVPVDSGIISGQRIGSVGGIIPGAQGTSTFSDTAVTASSTILIFPGNAAGGLLLRSNSCWQGTASAGSFTFNVSATANGLPTGNESFFYVNFIPGPEQIG